MGAPEVTVLTVGHSNRTTAELVALLLEHGVAELVDVRRYPGSRRHPHFRREALAEDLPAVGVRYVHEADLGGHREPRDDSPNGTWSEPAFRAYADHMASAAFRAALERLLATAGERRVAVMCAEADPERCHRKLLSDALVARGARVVHVLGPGRTALHALHPAARVGEGGALVYPGTAGRQLDLF